MFVGKVARGNPGSGDENNLIDGTETASNLYFNTKWAFWSYLKGILVEVFVNDNVGWDQVCVTNMVKCNNSYTTDETSDLMKSACIDENEFIWEEIKVLKPDLIIFVTGRNYDSYIEKYMRKNNYYQKTSKTNSVNCGAKKLPWWEMFDSSSGTKVLRTGHPERMNKNEYIKLISDFIKDEQNII